MKLTGRNMDAAQVSSPVYVIANSGINSGRIAELVVPLSESRLRWHRLSAEEPKALPRPYLDEVNAARF